MIKWLKRILSPKKNDLPAGNKRERTDPTSFQDKKLLEELQKRLLSLEEINLKLTQKIRESKKIEEELKNSEYLKTTILETAMDGIILADSIGTVLNWNKQAENILRLNKEETIGKSIFSLVPYKLRQELKNSFSNYRKYGEDQFINKRVETSVTAGNGDIIYIELTIIAIEIKNDFVFNAFFRDITNRKIIDNEIREAKVVAEKSAKAKSVFLSNMSHEIRTPLNVILGLTSILQKSNFDNPVIDKKNLDGIQFSAENLLMLINDILDFSKIEAGKLTLHNTDFNIKELILNISRGFKIKADEKGLVYKMFIDPLVPKFIIGDQLRLNQILINLLGNAIKFTHQGQVAIQVTMVNNDDNFITINFSVSDTGVGIPMDKLKNIFESFYQIHKPGKNKIEGTGLGLSISKQLIEIQGGTLHAESKLGVGSTFNFSIKYGKSDFKSSTTIKNQSTTGNTTLISGMKILVVEDNKMNQFFIKQLLANWDIDADIAEHGEIALNKLEDNVYDMILMDMHMPIMDGPETAEQIRQSKNSKINKIPIVACSADVFPESKKKAIEAGMNFYLTKPISEEALEEILYSLKQKATQKTMPETKPMQDLKKPQSPIVKKKCDLSFLKKTFDNDTEIIKSVLQIFLEETPGDYKKLQIAIEDQNEINTKEVAHKLKSSFKTIGLEGPSLILEQIEHLSKDHHFEKISKLFFELDLSFSEIINEIKDSLQEFDSSQN